jgi:hypothetical protein
VEPNRRVELVWVRPDGLDELSNAIKVGAAGFDGESGLAIGYARRINESVTVNAELATGFPDVIARGGVNYSF